jgi:hypothetical protein
MKPRKLLRTVFTVQFDRRLDAWTVVAGSTVVRAYRTKSNAVALGAIMARMTAATPMPGARPLFGPAATHRLCAQLRVRDRDGTWGPERTFGFDPKRRKG